MTRSMAPASKSVTASVARSLIGRFLGITEPGSQRHAARASAVRRPPRATAPAARRSRRSAAPRRGATGRPRAGRPGAGRAPRGTGRPAPAGRPAGWARSAETPGGRARGRHPRATRPATPRDARRASGGTGDRGRRRRGYTRGCAAARRPARPRRLPEPLEALGRLQERLLHQVRGIEPAPERRVEPLAGQPSQEPAVAVQQRAQRPAVAGPCPGDQVSHVVGDVLRSRFHRLPRWKESHRPGRVRRERFDSSCRFRAPRIGPIGDFQHRRDDPAPKPARIVHDPGDRR